MQRIETQTGNAECAQTEGTHQKTGHQIGGDGGQIEKFCHTGQKQAANNSDGQAN
jgi:hypothetical protein